MIGPSDRLGQIDDLARAVTSALDLETVLSHVIEAVTSLRTDVYCTIRLVDHEAGGYRLAGVGGVATAHRVPVLGFGEGLTHVVAESRQPLLVTDILADPRVPGKDWFADRGLTVYCGTPIQAGQELLGVLNTYLPTGTAPTAEERALLHLLANQAAVAIHNARLFAGSEAGRRAAEALASVGRLLSETLDAHAVGQRIADGILSLLRVRSSILFRLDGEADDPVAVALAGEIAAHLAPGVVFPRGRGALGLAIRERRPVFSSDVYADPEIADSPGLRVRIEPEERAVLAVPLLVRGRVIGALFLRDRTGRAFAEQDVQLARAFADQAAVAFENVRLYQTATRERDRLEALYAVSRRVASMDDTDEILGVIVNEAARLLGAEAAGLRTVDGEELVLRARTASANALLLRPRLRVGESLSGMIVQTGRPVRVEDVLEDTRLHPAHKISARELGYHGFAGVPLRSPSGVIGTLYVYALSRRRFTAEEEALLGALADQASLALEQHAGTRRLRALARLNQAVSSSLDTGDVLREITRAAGELMDVPCASIAIVDEAGRHLVRQAFSDETIGADHPGGVRRFGEGGSGWVAEHRQPLHVPDVFADDRIASPEWFRKHALRSSLSVPIVFGDALLGVLGLYGRKPFTLGPEDRGLLDSFVAQAAIAIHNARLYEELRVAHEQLERSQEQLVHSEKLSALGQLVAGVAHELNNPLSAVLGSAYLAERHVVQTPAERHVHRIRDAAERAAQIVRNLLQFARDTTGRREQMEINTLVRRVADLTLHAGATQNVRLALDLAAGLPTTHGDPGQIEQVLLNLITNAYQAMEGQAGEVTVRTRGTPDTVRIEVSDTGPGVAPETRTKVFDPFFTTKPVGKGTGLGLSVAHGIVAMHGGRIWLDEGGPGATFVVEIPVKRGPAPAAPAVLPPPGSGRVLVIDDEAQVAEVLADLLAELGAGVAVAHSAAEGRRLLAHEPFDLVALDLVMPDEGGADLWRWLAREMPAVAGKVVFITGTIDPAMQKFIASTGRPSLAKPYTLSALQELVASELGR